MPADIRILRVYQYIGASILLTLAGLMPFISEQLKIFGAIDKFHLALYAFTIALLLLWIWSTWYELNHVLNKWLDPRNYAVPQGLFSVGMIAIMVGILALLFVSVPKIERYVAIFTFYSFFNLYGSIYVLSHIAYAVQETKKLSSTEDVRIAVDAIQEYWVKHIKHVQRTDSIFFPYKIDRGWRSWFKNPYFVRLFICFTAGLALFPVTIMAKRVNSSTLEHISYVAMILILVVSEIVINLWRLKRDQRILNAEITASRESKTIKDDIDDA
jgi:hypothetical protein